MKDVAPIKFNAIQAIQGNRYNYIIQIPLSLVEQLFYFPNAENLNKSYQRKINKLREQEIANYINGNNYVLPPVVAFPVEGGFVFTEHQIDHVHVSQKTGVIELAENTKFGLFDGQHRISGIIQALKGKNDLAAHSISVMLTQKPTLQVAQQFFADINLNAVKPSQSIKLFFNNRDAISNLTKHIIKNSPLLAELTDFGASNLAKDSQKLFSFSAIYSMVNELHKGLSNDYSFEEKAEIIIEFSQTLTESFTPFLNVFEKNISSEQLRADSIAPFAVTLQALGIFGKTVINSNPDNWKELVEKLYLVSFHKSTTHWQNRVIQQGKIKKSRTNSQLIANVILKALNITLSGDNLAVENKFLGIQNEVIL